VVSAVSTEIVALHCGDSAAHWTTNHLLCAFQLSPRLLIRLLCMSEYITIIYYPFTIVNNYMEAVSIYPVISLYIRIRQELQLADVRSVRSQGMMATHSRTLLATHRHTLLLSRRLPRGRTVAT
jgi:hypothetical protein